jgi:hypothetical protein
MQYNQPYGESDPNAPYVNGNPSVGLRGSIPPAASIEYPQRELVNFMTDTGLTPSNADLHQLGKSVMTGMVHYGVDAGTKNALSVMLTPAPDKYYDGMFVFVVVAVSNDAAATININGLGVKNIVRRGGGPVQAGDLLQDYKSLLCYSARHGNFELYGINFAAGGGTGFLPVLTANTTWYVNGTTGSDTLYDGTAPTVSGPHGPFKTISRAITEIYKYGPSVYTATVQVAAGTYNESVVSPNFPGPGVVINGAGKGSTFLNGNNNNHCFTVGGPNTWKVTNFTTQTGTGAGPPCNFIAYSGGTLTTADCASQGVTPFAVFEAYGSCHVVAGNHTFNAGSNFGLGFCAFFGGLMGTSPSALYTFAGACSMPAGNAFATAGSGGYVASGVPNPPTFVNPAYLTGMKFNATVNGVINIEGLGPNWFPGTLPGQTSLGGQFL